MKQHADWYVKVDLAVLELKRGNAVEAYRLCSEAAQNPQDEEFKLGLFMTLARAALASGERQVAAEHIELSKVIRMNNGWKIPSELAKLEHDTQIALNNAGEVWPQMSSDVQELTRTCQKRWREGASAGLTRRTGKLARIDPSRPFSFIFPDDNSEKVFVLLKNIPRRLMVEGQRVAFVLKPSFDRKRGTESVEAVDIRAADR
jgi:cold shock CspA family protein